MQPTQLSLRFNLGSAVILRFDRREEWSASNALVARLGSLELGIDTTGLPSGSIERAHEAARRVLAGLGCKGIIAHAVGATVWLEPPRPMPFDVNITGPGWTLQRLEGVQQIIPASAEWDEISGVGRLSPAAGGPSFEAILARLRAGGSVRVSLSGLDYQVRPDLRRKGGVRLVPRHGPDRVPVRPAPAPEAPALC